MGPNQERRTDQIASRLSVSAQVSFIKTVTYKGIGERLLDFVVVRRFATGDVFVLIFAVNYILNLYKPRLIKLAKI